MSTLGEDETIARLASGIWRFKLPDEFNFIRIYRQIADDPKTGHGEDSLGQLAQIFENRRQYSQAADYWRRSIKEYGPGGTDFKKLRLEQITGNWGRFEPVMSQPAGKGATIDFRFRNGTKVSFQAREINVSKLLDDVKMYLKSSPVQLDWQKLNIADLGFRLVQQNEQKYLGDRVAQWDLDLHPRPEHFDQRVTVSTPLQKAGAYLLTAKMNGGNTSQIIVWLQDTAIVKKPVAGGMFYYVADAQTGAPIAKANVEFFGFRQREVDRNRYTIDVRDFAENTDTEGQIVTGSKDKDEQFQWMIIATAVEGRLAYLGFTGVWNGNAGEYEYNQTKAYTITDRPVYRPGQKVHFKFWVRHAQYDQDDKSDFANQTFNVEIQDPKGEKVLAKAFTADNYGGLDGDFDLPADATLGVYQLFVVNYGGGSFRVEEYKKPEFEVTVDAPTEPVLLGDKIKATVQAKYYFGSPVTDAKVKYKVLRTNHNGRWYPLGRWDWLYGSGYWWFASDYAWYPGWQRWGCPRPAPIWWGFNIQQPPEVVAEGELPIGPEGKLDIEIDTAPAKLIHPNQDHQYTVTAEVVDASRRTIVGQGSVLVARKPFQVYAWVDRGYYRVGDTIRADFQTQTFDQKPVRGKGVVSLYQIAYKNAKPQETLVRQWEQLDPDAQGHADLQLNASTPGQYRLAYEVTDDKQHRIEGAYLFTIIGEGFDSRNFRFNDLELIADQREYNPGQTVNLMVNANHPNGTVLLFIRPANGVYSKPKVLRLAGKSAVEEIAVVKQDMPNFFVEAVTIAGGKLYNELREVVVPPESRVLDVSVVPSSDTYKPGDKASVNIKLTDSAGQPFIGSAVVAIYDKAVEYISGGSNVEDIKAFFWKWRRNHYPQNETNLMREFANLKPSDQTGMDNLGVFGETVVDELNGNAADREALSARSRLGSHMMKAAAPMATARGMNAELAMDSAKPEAAGGANAAQLAEPTVRTNFADTALWAGSLSTDENGTAQVALVMPENLTTWKIRVWGMGHGTKVGEGQTDVVTRKNVIIRLEGPRFFVEQDEVVLSGVVHNYLKSAKQVTVALELDGKCLTSLTDRTRQVEVPSNGEVRVDWRVKVDHEGQATVRMKALSDEESDAVQQSFPVYVHGMLKTESFSGSLRPEESIGKISLRVPAERRIQQSRLEVRYSPTLAGAMVDALPYLADYPYGCTEQTLNRFLPTVITQRVLINMGLDLKKIQEKRSNLNSQQIGNAERAKQWKRFERNPVFDQDEVAQMVKDGVQALTQMQLSDGGWGWFSGWQEQSYPHTTAVVVRGLQIAKDNDVALVPGVLERGVEWLKNYQSRQIQLLKNSGAQPKPIEPYKTAADNLDAFVYMVLADAGIADDDMRGFLFRDRTQLAVYSKAMFGLALAKQGHKEQLDMLLQNLRQFVVEDEENQTAYLKLPESNFWWFWYGSETEANAYYLKLLAKTDPHDRLASRLVKYLLNNRQHATYWNSTRDTALAVEALADYLKASGEDKPDLTVAIFLDGKQQKEVKITAADLFTFDNKFVLEGDAVETGAHQLELRKTGSSPLYYNAYLTNFTLEDPISAASFEVKVNRKYYKLNPVDKTVQVSGSRGQSIHQKVEKYERQELPNLGSLKSGDLVEIELEIDSKNDYEYVMFEDLKAAGFEPVELRSGYNGNSLGAYMELRDNRVTFFVRWLARGKHSLSYRLRAEIPGRFSALPATASAMYAPELRGNSDEIKLNISD
ncbi:MAG TPA: MG2 domain-containing protein [Pirellulales bacterium]